MDFIVLLYSIQSPLFTEYNATLTSKILNKISQIVTKLIKSQKRIVSH